MCCLRPRSKSDTDPGCRDAAMKKRDKIPAFRRVCCPVVRDRQ